MAELWLQFGVVLVWQAAVLCAVAWWRGAGTAELWQVTAAGFALALPFGFAFDIIAGSQWGMFSYTFGYEAVGFLFLNALLSYGLYVATIYFVRGCSIPGLVLVGWALGILYEPVNYLFPVWEWQLPTAFALEQFLIIALAYPALLLTGWLVWEGVLYVVGE